MKPVGVYTGNVMWGQPPVNDVRHPNHEPSWNKIHAEFDPFCHGGGYMISGDVAKYLSDPPLAPAKMVNEDVQVCVCVCVCVCVSKRAVYKV
jgi:hypothetical protein